MTVIIYEATIKFHTTIGLCVVVEFEILPLETEAQPAYRQAG
jgi:hypothetical protein